MTAAVLTNPLDVLKTRLQSDFYQTQLSETRSASRRGVPPSPLHTLSSTRSASRGVLPPSPLTTFSSPRPASRGGVLPSSRLTTLSFPRSAALHIRETFQILFGVPRSAGLHIRETFQILFAVPRVEGWRALFKGLGPALVGVVPARAIGFYTYGNGKRIMADWTNNGQESAWIHVCAAMSAGMLTGTATCPIWVVKTRLQLDKNQAQKKEVSGLLQQLDKNKNQAQKKETSGLLQQLDKNQAQKKETSSVTATTAVDESKKKRRYRNAIDCTMQTFRQEGIRGFYRGLGATYLGVSESTLHFVLYEQMKAALKRRNQRIIESGKPKTSWDETIDWTGKAASAGLGKFFAAIITYPHEVVRTRLRQAPMQDGRMRYTGITQCVKLMIKEEGLMAFYGGLVPHIMRVVPSAAIVFGVYEGILKLLETDSSLE